MKIVGAPTDELAQERVCRHEPVVVDVLDRAQQLVYSLSAKIAVEPLFIVVPLLQEHRQVVEQTGGRLQERRQRNRMAS